MTARAFLAFIAEIRGFDRDEAKRRVAAAVEKTAARLRARAEDRDAVQGLQAPRRHRPGDPARPAGADHGRAHRRPRSQPEAPGAQADRRDGGGQGHHRLHPHPRGGGGGVLARHHHQPRPHRRRRHGRGPDAAPALPRRHRHARAGRAAPRPSAKRAVGVRGHRHGRDRRRRQRPACSCGRCPSNGAADRRRARRPHPRSG